MGRWGRIAVAGTVAAALLAAGWAWLGRPQILVDAPTARIACLSYAPFRDGETPFDPDFVVPAERIAEDLAALAPYSDCVRIYSVGQGLDAVLPAARAAGIEVLMGLWLGSDPAANEREIEAGIRLANEYADTIRAVVVGNEVLLRRELTPVALAAYIDRVRVAVPPPVTYADVWEFWLRNAPLAEHVDFITIHILPYWEDEPVAVENSIAHLDAVFDQVRAAFPDRILLVGETGWPSAGRIRDDAEPGRVAQARFVREFLAYTSAEHLDYNLIEAFDQGWKRRLEGAVGGHWGIVEHSGAMKFPLTGPVREDERAWSGFAMSFGLALVLVFFALRSSTETHLPAAGAVGAVAALAGAALTVQFDRIGETAIDLGEWLLEAGLVLLAALMAANIASWYALPASARLSPAPARQLLGAPRATFDLAARLGWLRLAGALVYLFVSLCVIVDPRYRDLPVATVAVAAVGFMLVALVGRRSTADAGDRLVGWLALAGGLIVLAREGIANDAAWVWAATGIGIALGWLVGLRAPRTVQREAENPRSTESRVSSSPTAPISVL
jgi:exo-beta-1,3-glucanase (GH17 family)